MRHMALSVMAAVAITVGGMDQPVAVAADIIPADKERHPADRERDPVHEERDMVVAVDELGAFSVTVGHSRLVRVPSGMSSVFIGDSTIADVTAAATDLLVVTGHETGTTNLIVLNEAGEPLMDVELSVVQPDIWPRRNVQVIANADEERIFICAPEAGCDWVLTRSIGAVGGEASTEEAPSTPAEDVDLSVEPDGNGEEATTEQP